MATPSHDDLLAGCSELKYSTENLIKGMLMEANNRESPLTPSSFVKRIN